MYIFLYIFQILSLHNMQLNLDDSWELRHSLPANFTMEWKYCNKLLCHRFLSLISEQNISSCSLPWTIVLFVWERLIVLEGNVVRNFLNSWALTCKMLNVMTCKASSVWMYLNRLFYTSARVQVWERNVRKHLYMCTHIF